MFRPITKRRFRKILISLLIILLTFVIAKYDSQIEQKTNISVDGTYQVTQVLDGDTVEIDMNGNREKIRFIGVDTPETHDPRKAVQCFGKAASNFTQSLVDNKRVRLEADALSTSRDRYNRLLRYVYVDANTLVNAEIIKQGYGFAYTGFDFTKSAEFKNYQNEARTSNRGLWASCNPEENQYGGFTSNDEQ